MKLIIRKTQLKNREWVVGDFPIFLLCLLIVISEIPIWSRIVPNIVFYGLFALLIFCTLGIYMSSRNSSRVLMVLMVVYFLILAVYKMLKVSSAAFSYYSTTVKSFVFVIAMTGLIEHMSKRQKKAIIFVVIASICFTLFDNMRIFFLYGATRFTRLFQTERFSTNAINTAYVYALLLFSGALFVVYSTTSKRALRISALALSVATVVFNTIIAQRATALVLALFMFPLLIINRKKNSWKKILSIGITLALFAVLLFFYDPLLDWLDNLIDSRRISVRLNQIRLIMANENISEAGGSVQGRYNLILRSLETTFSSVRRFVFGAGDHRNDYTIIGNHSHFVDELARYGLVGMLVWIPMVWNMLAEMRRVSLIGNDSVLRGELIALQLTYLIRGFLGGIFEASISIQMFIFIPLIFNLLEEQRTKTI